MTLDTVTLFRKRRKNLFLTTIWDKKVFQQIDVFYEI